MTSLLVLNSTGQTLADLQALGRLAALLNQTSFVPPALSDPGYVPPKQNIYGPLIGSLVGLVLATALVAFKIIHTQRIRYNPIPFLEDWLLVIGVVSSLYHVQ